MSDFWREIVVLLSAFALSIGMLIVGMFAYLALLAWTAPSYYRRCAEQGRRDRILADEMDREIAGRRAPPGAPE